MRNYIIINGVNSLTIPGLAVKALPPISKPAMRTLREEIDGRNGDMTTELGYGSYDRTLEVGMYGAYDIDRIIAFFNSKGTITFSDEPDKFYNFEITDRIDFAKLIKFRTATINLHCQPFKYPINEEPQEIEFQYVNGSGKDISLDNTSSQPMQVDLEGELEQVTYTGKNILEIKDVNTTTTNGVTYSIKDGELVFNGTSSVGFSVAFTPTTNFSFINEKINKGDMTITLEKSGSQSGSIELNFGTSDNAWRYQIRTDATTRTMAYSGDITRFSIYIPVNLTFNNFKLKIQMTAESTSTPYEPYVGGVPSPSPSYPQSIDVVEGYNLYNGLEENSYANSVGAIVKNASSQYIGIGEYIECEPNTTYSVYFEHDISNKTMWVSFKEKGGVFISRTSYATQRKFTTPSNAYQVYFYLYDSDGKFTNLGNVQLVKGEEQKNYLPYNNIGVNVVGKNLFPNEAKNQTINGIQYTINSDKSITCVGTATSISDLYLWGGSQDNGVYLEIPQGEYALSSVPDLFFVRTKDDGVLFKAHLVNTLKTKSIKIYGIVLRINQNSSINTTYYPQLEQGSIATPYQPHQEQIYTIDLQDNFLAKIGDVKDELKIAKDGSVKLIKRIGKVVLDGTQTINYYGQYVGHSLFYYGVLPNCKLNQQYNIIHVTNQYISIKNNDQAYMTNYQTRVRADDGRLYWNDDRYTNASDMQNAFVSKPLEVYYILAEPQEINLEPIRPINAIIPQTNITTLATIKGNMNVETMKLGSDEAVLQNEGNIYSNPKIDIVGSGIINISLNGSQMFQVDLSENDEIIIDTDALEAYNPNTNQLMNRDVIGDYDNFRLQPGNNTLKLGGDVQHASITNYKRWL